MTDGSGTQDGRIRVVGTQLALWVAAAMLGALLTLAWGWITRPGFSVFRWAWDSRDVLWSAPLGYLVVFAPFGILLTLLALVIKRAWSLRIALFVWMTLVFFSVFLLFPQIHGYAWFVIALALAARLTPVLARRERAVERAARTLALGLSGLAIAGFFIITVGRRNAENEALAELPPATAGAPNVLLIILDTVRSQSLSLYGYEIPTTPFLEELATRSVVFEEAYSTAPWTTPSHASLFTGQYPSQQSSSWVSPLADSEVTIAEVLRSRGYATGGFTANLGATRYESGLAQGFIRYEDLKTTSPKEIAQTTTITQSDNILQFWDSWRRGRGIRLSVKVFLNSTFAPNWTELTHDLKSAEEVTTSSLAWLESIGTKRPFFVFLNYFDAHSPYRPPEPYYSMFNKPPLTLDRYNGGIRYIDDQLKRLMSGLESRGDLSNTIIIISSDHGEQFGEHGLRAHGNSLYRQVIRVPLLVSYPPSVPGGVRVARQVTNLDVPATILDLAKVPHDPAIGGVSLAGTWRDSSYTTSPVFAELDMSLRRGRAKRNLAGAMKAIINDTAHVIRDGEAGVEAYAYRIDPEETRDIAKDTVANDIFSRMLDQEIEKNGLKWRTLVGNKDK